MRSKSDRTIAFLMLLPSVIVLAIFVYYFIGRTIQTSMTDWGEDPIMKPPMAEDVQKDYIGLDNYHTLMTNVVEFRFRDSLVNTFFFTLFFLAGCVSVGFGLAIILDQKIVGEGFFRTIFLFPMALSFVVTGTIWRWLLQPGGGLNVLPEKLFGMEPLEYGWINSKGQILNFQWADIPMYLTYLGLIIIGFLVFNFLSRENDRIGVASQLLIQCFMVGALAAGLAALVGMAGNVIIIGIISAIGWLIYQIFWNKVVFTAQDYVPRQWTAMSYILAAGLLLVVVYVAGFWDKIFLPLDVPLAEQPKGYNAALSGIILAAIWQMSGYTMAMFLAGIRGVPDELREAARVDGCSEVGVYRSIIIPMLRPVILSAMIVLGHISLKIFDLVWAMSGPDNPETVVPGILVYTTGFRSNRFASASSIAVIMLFLVGLVIIPYLWNSLRQEQANEK